MITWRVGTCGWQYAHWRGPFYPADLPNREMLASYARRLDCVECDNPFYRLPSPEAVAAWRACTPEGFRFAWKASRYLTHLKRLREPEEPLERIRAAVAPLGDRLGPVLFQLPPRQRRDVDRLRHLLGCVPREWRVAVEFRDPDWHHPDVYRALADHGAAFVVWELGGVVSPVLATAPFVYARLHGPGGRYRGRYGDDGVRAWAERLAALGAGEAWVLFDNDEAGNAALDALALQAFIRNG
jgi:uncharacterized protein YecE (DUF72 family)